MNPIHVSPSITLTPLSIADAQIIFDIIDSQREYLGKWLPFVSSTQTVDDPAKFIESVYNEPEEIREHVFGIHVEEIFVGLVGLKFNKESRKNQRAEIGYWLSEKEQKKGIVTRSVKALIDYAFLELALNRVQIRCAVGNLPSKSIAQRLGFHLEGIERDGELLSDNTFTDLEVYSLLKREWVKA